MTEMTERITLVANSDSLGADEVCLDDDGRGSIVHARGADCARLHGLRIVDYRCSVCDLYWPSVALSQHEGCAGLLLGGGREYAYRRALLSDGSEMVEGDEANARLIAAAPDLLAALVQLTAEHDNAPDAYDDTVWSLLVRPAIAKATGA